MVAQQRIEQLEKEIELLQDANDKTQSLLETSMQVFYLFYFYYYYYLKRERERERESEKQVRGGTAAGKGD